MVYIILWCIFGARKFLSVVGAGRGRGFGNHYNGGGGSGSGGGFGENPVSVSRDRGGFDSSRGSRRGRNSNQPYCSFSVTKIMVKFLSKIMVKV